MHTKWITQWLVSALSIGIAAYLLPWVSVTLLGAVVLSVVLGIINAFIKPIIIILTLPITILTLGLFSLVINALFIMLAAWVVPGFAVSGFWAAMAFGVVLAFVNALFNLWR